MKKILYITTFSLFIPTFFAHAYSFTNTMKVGSRGQDVYELQKIFNSDPKTAISTSNNRGSYGNETDYFGLLTKEAVIRFQNLYKEQILYPNGLTQGTGFVGKSTITFLNEKLSNKTTAINSAQPETTLSTTSLPTIKNNTQKFFVSKQTIQPKDILYVGSETDLTNIDFYLDSYKVDKGCKHSKYTCSFYASVNPGEYTLKTNDSSLGEYKIKVLNKGEKRPEVNIKSLSLLKENLVKGKNFTDTVKIYTMYGVFTSETQNDSFILKFPEEYAAKAKLTEGLFYIENNNGLASKVKNIHYEK